MKTPNKTGIEYYDLHAENDAKNFLQSIGYIFPEDRFIMQKGEFPMLINHNSKIEAEYTKYPNQPVKAKYYLRYYPLDYIDLLKQYNLKINNL